MPPNEPLQEPALLSFSQSGQRWEYKVHDRVILWLSDAVFQRYVDAWLSVRGIIEPNEQQIYEAFGHCRARNYWTRCQDPQVHMAHPTVLLQH